MAENLWLYAVLVFGIVVLPGMDMAFVLASTLADGRRAGFAAVAGLTLGGLGHVLMSACGIGLLLQRWPALSNAVLAVGALYVAWLGLSLARHTGALVQVADAPSRPLHVTFARATATCLLNPKAYLFMLAVFPQFLRPERGGLWWQALSLFLVGAASQVLVYGSVALAADRVRSALRDSARAQVALGRSIALLLMLTAAWALTSGWR
ncbi:MAG TPA: LysE family translocator [Burkholderiaceae bacterium]|jgi:threonine/homoserine/homoserine lactone efflux protein|nr:LysE family translocator [Burkholderiaceae bacterium]